MFAKATSHAQTDDANRLYDTCTVHIRYHGVAVVAQSHISIS